MESVGGTGYGDHLTSELAGGGIMKRTTEKIIEGLQKPTWTVGYPPSDLSDLLALLKSLLCAVNQVTAPHRHGNTIPKSALDGLCNRQLEIEKAVEKFE